MKLYTFYTIISSDINKQENYILSAKKNEIVLPYSEIMIPRVMMNEVKYNVKNMFDTGIISFIEEIIISYIDIQNEMLLEYVEKNVNNAEVDPNENLFVLCGMIMNKKSTSKLFWNKFTYSLDQKMNNPIFALIDMTIQKSLL
jgi:hypothetical protein